MDPRDWTTIDGMKWKRVTERGSSITIFPKKEGEMLIGFSWVATNPEGAQKWSDNTFESVHSAMLDCQPRFAWEVSRVKETE